MRLIVSTMPFVWLLRLHASLNSQHVRLQLICSLYEGQPASGLCHDARSISDYAELLSKSSQTFIWHREAPGMSSKARKTQKFEDLAFARVSLSYWNTRLKRSSRDNFISTPTQYQVKRKPVRNSQSENPSWDYHCFKYVAAARVGKDGMVDDHWKGQTTGEWPGIEV